MTTVKLKYLNGSTRTFEVDQASVHDGAVHAVVGESNFYVSLSQLAFAIIEPSGGIQSNSAAWGT